MADTARPSTPPRDATATSSTASRNPLTPEQTRRIEQNRLLAKARREQALLEQKAANKPSISRTPSGFIASDNASLPQTRKRTAEAAGISTTAFAATVPSTSRDAAAAQAQLTHIEPARKFKKFVDHDFSAMTDTKGGFLAEEDDPHNSRAFRARQDPSVGPENKPAHMTLKEWERLQLLRQLRKRREGVFEPGISLDEKEAKKCRECGSREIDWQWEEVFGCCVCHRCKDKFPDKYSLLTKTEAREDYLLTTEELADEQLFRHLEKPNPHASHWSEMWLFLRYQIEEYAFSPKKWGSPEALDAEFSRREGAKKKRKEEKFQLKLKELKRKTRAEHYKRVNGEGGGEAKFGARIGGGKHEHEWGRTVEKADGSSVKTCLECGMEVEELEF